jgi:hypothetical protein
MFQTKPHLTGINQTNYKLSAKLSNTVQAPDTLSKTLPLIYLIMTCIENPSYATTDIKQVRAWANVPELIHFLIITCWVNRSKHSKLLHLQLLVYVAFST